jgi:hypothetical protein
MGLVGLIPAHWGPIHRRYFDYHRRTRADLPGVHRSWPGMRYPRRMQYEFAGDKPAGYKQNSSSGWACASLYVHIRFDILSLPK